MTLLSILSLVPFGIFLYLLFGKKTTLFRSSLWTLIVTTILVLLYWQIDPSWLAVSYVKGFFVALDILLIIFGAIFFLEIMRELKIISNISGYLENISRDYRIQVILLAWFLGSFLEGTAGFGAPSTIVAPLLVGLGLSPLKAVVVSLLGNSTPVVFGSAGTPIRTGFAGLDWSGVPALAASINIIGLFIPVLMLWFLTIGQKNAKRDFWEAVPFAVWSGIAFVIPSLLTVFLGQEFPSIFGAIIGLVLILISIKLKLFTPKIIRTYKDEKIPPINIPLSRALIPYILLVIFLVIGKFLLGTYSLPIPFGINHNFNLYNPSFAFILSGIITIIFWRHRKTIIQSASNVAWKKSLEPFLIVAIMSVIVQLFINSGYNANHLSSIIKLIADLFTSIFLPIWAPILGMFGSFITGSATVANIMFGKILFDSAQVLNYDTAKILALCLVGGAAGNMIALADVLTAETVVGLKNRERTIIGRLLLPCLIYSLMAGLIGWWIK